MTIAPFLKPDYAYQNDRVVVLPYSDAHTEIYPETFWASIYRRLKEEGTLNLIFPGLELNNLNSFICYMGDSRRLGRLVCCLKCPDRPPLTVGLGWLCEYDRGKASFGFGYFKEVWGKRVHIDMSMLMLAYWCQELKCDVLYGTTLNPLALRYSKRFGFTYLCRLPKFFFQEGELKDASLIVLEKATFLPYYRQWRGYSYGIEGAKSVNPEYAIAVDAGAD